MQRQGSTSIAGSKTAGSQQTRFLSITRMVWAKRRTLEMVPNSFAPTQHRGSLVESGHDLVRARVIVFSPHISKLNEIQRSLIGSDCRTYGLAHLYLIVRRIKTYACRAIQCSVLACAFFSKVVHQKRLGNLQILAIEHASVARRKN